MSHPTEPENNPAVAHEQTDADSYAITKFGIGLAFLVIVGQLLLWWLFDSFSARETKLSPHVPAIVKMQAPRLPPEPRLQGNAPLDLNPRLDLKKMREDENAFLYHYGWIDPDRGIVHIPIDQALDIVAKSGLPQFKPMEPKPAAAPAKGSRANPRTARAPSRQAHVLARPAQPDRVTQAFARVSQAPEPSGVK